jgi:hypothetical protein
MTAKLQNCHPKWMEFGPNSDGHVWKRGLVFKCPRCHFTHIIEFRPVIGPSVRKDSERAMAKQPVVPAQPIWQRHGDTFECLCISPAIRNGDCQVTIHNGEFL